MDNKDIAFRKYEKLKTQRSQMTSYWRDIEKYCMPGVSPYTGIKQEAKSKPDVYDGSAFRASAILSSGLYSQLTNPSSRWFGLHIADGDVKTKSWVRMLENTMYEKFMEDGFYTSASMFYNDLVHYGVACLYESINIDGGLEFNVISPNNLLFSENRKGDVTEVFVEFSLSAEEAISRFGDALSDSYKSKAKEGNGEKLEFLSWAYYSGDDIFPIYETYYEKDTKTAVALEKYRSMPYFVVRWDKRSGRLYGSSPSLVALPDVKMINRMVKTTVKGAELGVLPAYSLPYDGYLEPITLESGGLNYRLTNDPNDSMIPITSGSNVSLGVDFIDIVRNKINEAYFVDLFLMTQTNTMTATEVIQRSQEKMLLLGSVVGRLFHDFLSPLIKRTLMLMLVYKIVAENKNVNMMSIKYSSPLAQSQKSAEYASIVQVLNTAMTIGQYDPAVFDNINSDVLIRKIGEIYASPPDIFTSVADVRAIRQQRVQQQQQQQQIEYAAADAKIKKQEASAQRDYVKSTLGK